MNMSLKCDLYVWVLSEKKNREVEGQGKKVRNHVGIVTSEAQEFRREVTMTEANEIQIIHPVSLSVWVN